MAFDQSTRGRLQKLVNTCRNLLSDEFSIQLQQTYGLDPKTGEVTPMARLTHLDDRQRHTAEVLRQTLAHYLGADVDDTDHRIAVLDRMVREQAFTVLNRLAALLMMEARGQLIDEYVTRDLSASRDHQLLNVPDVAVARDLALGAIFYGIETMLTEPTRSNHAEDLIRHVLVGLGLDAAEALRIVSMPLQMPDRVPGPIFDSLE